MDKGLLSPSQFVKPLEESGLIWMLDDYMWESAARLLSQWQRNGIDFYISVNISPKDFYYTDVLKRFRELIQKYEFNPSKLNVEITETEFINTGLMYASVINGLKSLGICIELDDFGSGYSSFKTLEDFEFDVLKIDMEFLRECENEEKAHSIISSVITMAKELGIKVVTEGVEEESQFNYLKEAGADIFQGYYFSKPLSFMEFENTYVHKGREVKA